MLIVALIQVKYTSFHIAEQHVAYRSSHFIYFGGNVIKEKEFIKSGK